MIVCRGWIEEAFEYVDWASIYYNIEWICVTEESWAGFDCSTGEVV